MAAEILERHMNIPKAVATRFAKPGSYDFEEYVSVGNLALVKASVDFDPSRVDPVAADFGAFAYQRVTWAIMAATGHSACSDGKRARRWAKTASIDTYDRHKRCSMASMLTASEVGEPAFVAKEAVEAALSRLKPLARAVFVASERDGLFCKEIAERLTRLGYRISRNWVDKIRGDARREIAKYVSELDYQFQTGGRLRVKRKCPKSTRQEWEIAAKLTEDVANRGCKGRRR